jgi:Family of unknown function (DUF5681)
MPQSIEIAREADGRFAPGQSGNPKGRPKGARNRMSLLAEALNEGDLKAILRGVVEHALAGDQLASRFLLNRVLPRRAPVELDLPEGAEHNSAAVHAILIRALASGEITPEEGAQLARVLAARRPVMAAHRDERRLAREDVPNGALADETGLPPDFAFPFPEAGYDPAEPEAETPPAEAAAGDSAAESAREAVTAAAPEAAPEPAGPPGPAPSAAAPASPATSSPQPRAEEPVFRVYPEFPPPPLAEREITAVTLALLTAGRRCGATESSERVPDREGETDAPTHERGRHHGGGAGEL